eukprot:CAMPEP_0113628878 /NCGR_PEP_ID=MMETSP0017_2-20120614/14975_1 /TAXON_ID=2856 /ORGANISM="Cylindrotheca closterium" /LENGTH=324 /DNA_ID=CAMNT_0000539223 /DNA_START=51 /DNA_END=1025 /DNA_ORIENTATION=- /assembly_acc=CAM_ASM_000147
MNVGDMALNGCPKPSISSKAKTYSVSTSRSSFTGNKTDLTTSPTSLTPSRQSFGGLSSVAERKKSRNSYLNKRPSRVGAGGRKELIRNSLFSKVDTVLGVETVDAADPSDVSFQNENSYLKRLLLSPSSGKKAKKLNVDNCRLQKKKKPQKLPQAPLVATNPAAKRIDKTKVAARLAERNRKDKTTKDPSKLSAEQNEKRLSTDSSTSTAPTEGSESTDHDALTHTTASMAIAETPVQEIDYMELFQSFESVAVDVNFEGPSVERQRKVSFAPQAQQASIADLIICAAHPSEKFQWEDLFYTEEELGDQRHEAFLEMVMLDDDF